MGKLSELFAQVRKTRSGRSIGFVGKNTPTMKPRAAALLVEYTTADAGNVEAAIKAGADGLIFAWHGQGSNSTGTLRKAIEAAKAANEGTICGLHMTGGWEKVTRKEFEDFKDLGLNFIVLPLSAPARLLALRVKDVEPVISVPMRDGDLYPVFVRNLAAFESVAGIHLDFGLSNDVSSMSIEDALHYRAVRNAVQTPALINLKSTPSEDDLYTLLTLGVQAVVLTGSQNTATTGQHIQALRELLEKVHHEEQETSTLGLNIKS